MFAYCNNNPVMACDPTGSIAITTIILISSVVLGVAASGYTAYSMSNAGYSTGDIIFHTLGAGICAFGTIYSLGMTGYGYYLAYCNAYGVTPTTYVGNGNNNVSTQLQSCANQANESISGTGATTGTKKHTAFANNVNSLGNSSLKTEASYLYGNSVPYGTKGSIRFDVIQFDSSGTPICAWDFKTGSATLTMARVAEMQAKSGLNIPIKMIR